jgi:hypothetical protein
LHGGVRFLSCVCLGSVCGRYGVRVRVTLKCSPMVQTFQKALWWKLDCFSEWVTKQIRIARPRINESSEERCVGPCSDRGFAEGWPCAFQDRQNRQEAQRSTCDEQRCQKTWEKSKANPHWHGEQGFFGGRGLWHEAPRFGLAMHGSIRFGLGHRMAWLAPPGLGSVGPGLACCVPGQLRPAPVQMGGDRLGLVLLDLAWLGNACAEEFGSPCRIRRALHAIYPVPLELLEKACVFLIDVDRRAAE